MIGKVTKPARRLSIRARNVLAKGACVAAFTAVVVSALAAYVPDIRDSPMAPTPEAGGVQATGWVPRAVALRESGGLPQVYTAWLRVENPLKVLRYPELRIRFATFRHRVQLTGATIVMSGTSCRYSSLPGAELVDNSFVAFYANPGCTAIDAAPDGLLTIAVRLARRSNVAVWTWQPPPDVEAGDSLQMVGARDAPGPFPLVDGRYVEYLAPTRTRRIDLLGYMWQISPRVEWIWMAIGVAAALLTIGIAAMPDGPAPDGSGRRTFAARTGVGAGCVAAALGICYAVIVPPFQAADESIHFLNYADVTNRADISRDADRWSALGHFDRLRFHPHERFRPVDVDHPSAAWREAAQQVASSRSTWNRLWKLFNGYLGHLSSERTLLGLRLFDVAVFAAAVAAGASVMPWLTDVPFPQLLLFPVLFIPSLVFFATYVSNYAALTSGYVLLASGVVVTALRGRRSDWAGLLLGVGTSLTIVMSRSALPMVLFVGFVLAGRAVAGRPSIGTWSAHLKVAAVFWGTLGVGLAAAPLLVDPQYRVIVPQYGTAVEWLRAWLPGITAWREWKYGDLVWIVVALLIVGMAIEASMSSARGALARYKWTHHAGTIAGLIALAIAVCLIGVMLASLVVQFPTLQFIDFASPPPFADYMNQVMLSELTFFRLRYHDHLLSSSFWAGFGWLDAIPPDWFIGTLSALTGSALVALLWYMRKNRMTAGLVVFGFIAAGFAATLTLYAYLTKAFADLHGRYLIGLYLSVLLLGWLLPALKPAGEKPGTWRVRCLLMFTLCIAAHAYSLYFILNRYF